MQKETKLKERFLPRLKELPNTKAEKIQQLSIKGTPDILMSCRSQHFAIELKVSDKSKVDLLQRKNLIEYHLSGSIAIFVHNDNVKFVLENIEKWAFKKDAKALQYLRILSEQYYHENQLVIENLNIRT